MNKPQTSLIITAGVFTGIITFILMLITLAFWKSGGFDLMEISLMTVLAGFYMMIAIIPVNIYFLNKYIAESFRNGVIPIKKIFQVLLSLLIAMVVFIAMDSIFYVLDDSLSVDFAAALAEMARNNGKELQAVDQFSKVPFSIQNGIITFVLGLIGTLISLAFVRRKNPVTESRYV